MSMKTKIVYVLVSSEDDLYLEQAVMSVCSVRQFNSDVYVEIVTDNQTESTIVGKRNLIRKYASEMHVVDVPREYSKAQRSRYIKTNLRKFVKGDYLFIDTDTVIRSSLADIDNLTHDVYAVRDLNMFSRFTKRYKTVVENYVSICDDILNEPYFNSGVMYVKDTPKAHQLYQVWYESWKDFCDMGLFLDQPVLCYANKLVGRIIHRLDDVWNYQTFYITERDINRIKIAHYMNGKCHSEYLLSNPEVLKTIKQTGQITPMLDYLIRNPQDTFIADGTLNKIVRMLRALTAKVRIYCGL